ncbi:MAG: hypothetical protein RL689_1809 [Planctomycetota bacterium]|jgi:hypothetical protein
MDVLAKRLPEHSSLFARTGAPVVAVVRCPALRASPRSHADARTVMTTIDETRRARRHRPGPPNRPTRVRTPVRGLARKASPRHTATSGVPSRARNRDDHRVKPLFARSGRTSRSRGALPGFAGEPTAARRYANGLGGDRRMPTGTPRDAIGRGPRIDQHADRTPAAARLCTPHRGEDRRIPTHAPHATPMSHGLIDTRIERLSVGLLAEPRCAPRLRLVRPAGRPEGCTPSFAHFTPRIFRR